MKVTVNAAPAGTPVFIVSAGPYRTITLPTNSVTTGVATVQSAGSVASCLWTQVSGPSTASLSGTGSITPTASSLVAGVYVFKVKVTVNASGGSAASGLTVTGQGVSIGPGLTERTVGLYPNPLPVDQELTIEGRNWKEGKLRVAIYDMSGRMVKQVVIGQSTVHFRQVIPVSGLGRGTYLLSIASDEGKRPSVLKFIIR